MKKKYKIQLPKGKKVTMTNVDFENGVMTVNVELENKEEPISEAEKVIKHLRSIDWDKRTKESVDRIRDELYHKKHPETISNYERWKSKFGKINNQLKEVLKANGVTREKIEEMAKESIKELEKDCPDIWDKMIQPYGEAIFGKTEQKYEPKDGDFVYVKARHEHIAIFKKEVADGMYVYANWNMSFSIPHIVMEDSIQLCRISDIREISPATEIEKTILIDQLAKVNKKWNEEKKCLENVRWRANYDDHYYYLLFGDTDLLVTETTDIRKDKDDERYNSGNYFKTSEAAEKASEQIRETFQNSKAE